ncbi:MAG: NAD-dependent epimerase/dehydratase family protein [Burkholderiaceae bacterium]
MHVLLTGSTGFIGRAVAAALQRAGHTVHGGVSPRSQGRQPAGVPMDFARDTSPAAWRPRLEGIDAVVNTVGVLRDSKARPIDAVHHATPAALFDACAQVGVRRVVQVSALGIDGSPTRYATTKRAAEDHLRGLAARGELQPVILRPSVVFGRGGNSSALFMNLARLPLLVMPGPMLTARVQPVSVLDLADAVAALLGSAQGTTGTVVCAGPEALTFAQLVASLRAQLGHGSASVLRLPDLLTRLSARMGDAVPGVPWCTEALQLLGSDNVGDPSTFERLIGRTGTHHSQLVATAWQ